MHIGVDFDNTIACYDALFHKIARERGLIPADVPVNKSDVRNHLRRTGNERAWTEMQGYVYGARMAEADPYPGALEFFRACHAAGVDISIVSHKTKYPILGDKHDLHAAALNWLEQQRFFDPAVIGMPRDRVHFELTKEAKLRRIGELGCTHFIDDLPEFLEEASFPANALRILFDSHELYSGTTNFIRVRTWSEILELFASELQSPQEIANLRSKVLPLLKTHPATDRIMLQPLPGGANNRVYRVRSENLDRVLKVYFQNSDDRRDRFHAERAFYSHLWRQGTRRTPEPFAWDEKSRLGLFSHVHGRKLDANEIDADAVRQALAFVIEVNRTKTSASAEAIPIASEACFSLAEHLSTVEGRIARLRQINGKSDLDLAAAAFVQEELIPAWKRIHSSILTSAKGDLRECLPKSERCLSPSDFGFHNALLSFDGKLLFFDFEYAGWDDPAKLICDFFCQPQRPVHFSHWQFFVESIRNELALDDGVCMRAKLLLPAYRIKWCAIMLNEFLPRERNRREFSLGMTEAEGRKQAQLARAKELLAQTVDFET